jgi:hypothetical protein
MTVNCATLKPAGKKEHRLTDDNGMSATNNRMLTFLDKEYENG